MEAGQAKPPAPQSPWFILRRGGRILAETVVITGAFSYTGKYAAQLLIDRGYAIRTLTHHPERTNPFGERVRAFPYNFDHPAELAESLRGAAVLVNTYWVRFPRRGSTFETAVENTRTLIGAAQAAGVRRIAHVSIANPSLDSPLGYYRGKAELERIVRESGLSYAILRPTVIFGVEDILINNIAWFVRHFPVFGIPGDGQYPIRPIYVEDMARLIADSAGERESAARDAVGPEQFSFEELVRLIAAQVRPTARIIHIPAGVAYPLTRLVGWPVGDTVLTWEEYKGLMGGLLGSDAPAAGQTRLSDWVRENAGRLGSNYASEVARHYDRRG